MAVEPPTIADLRKTSIINSQEVVAAIDAYLRDAAAIMAAHPVAPQP